MYNGVMPVSKSYEPEFESLMDLLVEMPQERSLENLLALIVRRFARRPHLSLARIWLVLPSDNCAVCAFFDECFDRQSCLHLVASAGNLPGKSDMLRSTEGAHSRIPLGHDLIGKVASTGQPRRFPDLEETPAELPGLEMLGNDNVRGFSCLPLVHRGEVLGVIAVYLKIPFPITTESRSWLRLVADQTAAAISNAQAFDEIERLKSRLELENAYLREEVRETSAFDRLIGQSDALAKVRQQIELVAPTDASVLVLGETGTGKELVAREIHGSSLRRDRPMIKVNCAAIVPELWESEFFGHVKGSFTGAVKDRSGRFELADEGTLFLDEVGEIPLELQSRLLRVLQEGSFERVGDEVTRRVDVRIIAASNRDLEREIKEGRFRRDLFYRLAVFPVTVAPLRERPDDIPQLAAHFIAVAQRKMNKKGFELTREGLRRLMDYEWPGNARELRNVIERAMITARDGKLEFNTSGYSDGTGREHAGARTPRSNDGPGRILTMTEIGRLEEDNIRAALCRTSGKIYGPGGAAELLGMKPTTLSSRLIKIKKVHPGK